MGDGLNEPLVNVECVLDQILAVACDGAAANGDAVAAKIIDVRKLFSHQLHGIAFVGAVVCIKQGLILCDQCKLGGGGAAVDAQPRSSAVACDIGLGNRRLFMACHEIVVFLLVFKEGRQTVGALFFGFGTFLNAADHLVKGKLLCISCVHCRTHRHRIKGVFGEDRPLGGKVQGLVKTASQTLAVVKRAAQEHHLAGDLSALDESGDGLIDHRLIDTHSDIRLACPLIQKGLNVGLGKNAATGGDGVDTCRL